MTTTHYAILYIAAGVLLPLAYTLGIDWWDVHVYPIDFLPDAVYWAIWMALSLHFLYRGVYLLLRNHYYTILINIVAIVLLAGLNVVLLLLFHTFIGGVK